MSLTPSTIKKVARLSRIAVNDSDVAYFQTQLNGILNWISDLEKVDVSQVDLQCLEKDPQMNEREDVVTAPNRVAEVLSNAPSSQHNMFTVPKVVE
jgi:aspartyl-tRNA(Asn)/glutamyl-tRNA(Gln) amidotransferase subunit C